MYEQLLVAKNTGSLTPQRRSELVGKVAREAASIKPAPNPAYEEIRAAAAQLRVAVRKADYEQLTATTIRCSSRCLHQSLQGIMIPILPRSTRVAVGRSFSSLRGVR